MSIRQHYITREFTFVLILLLVFAFNTQSFAKQQDTNKQQDFFEMSLEELMEVPVVFASSKRLQPITEAASSVVVITAEDIKQSGAISIPDVLRQVAGINVRELEYGAQEIGIRGLADNRHVLINLDGSNVYIYHVNTIFWEAIPVSLDEIDRIEIIKGPGAIFHGGNAFSGVINIITKSPEQLKGTQVNLTGGEKETALGNIIHAGSYKKLDYSVNVGHREANRWESSRQGAVTDYFGIKSIYHLDDESSLSSSFRYADSDNLFLTTNVRSIYYPENRYIDLRYDRPDFWAKFFWNHHYKPGRSTPAPDYLPTGLYDIWEDDSYELELMRTFRWSKNATSIGAYAKKTILQAGVETMEPDKSDTEQWAINIENEHRFTDQLLFTLGGRFEKHSVLDDLYLGRSSLIYSPVKDHTFRLTAASGYFIPSHMELVTDYLDKSGYHIVGNRDLKEEKISSLELGYYGLLTNRVKVNTNLFYSRIKDLNYFLGRFTPPNILTTINGPDLDQWGGELGFDLLFTDWLSSFANYAYVRVDRDDWGSLETVPRHKFNYGLRAKFRNGISANLILHYVDKSYCIEGTSYPLSTPLKLEDYTTVDLRLAYKPNANLEFALAASNLFDDRHIEDRLGGKIGRRITAIVTYKF